MQGFLGPAPTHPRIPDAPSCIVLRPFCTMVDWLSVMMMGPWHCVKLDIGECIPWDVENVRPGLAVYGAEGTKHFGKRFFVTDQIGTKLITILAAPVDRKKFPPDFCTAQFSNETLASGEWRELLRALRMMGCEHMGVQRVDIAADGWEDETIGGGGDYIRVVQAAMVCGGDYYGKSHWKTHHLKKSFNGFEFGSRAGNKFMRCYRKKREMKAQGHKPHIVDAWRAALDGYDVMKDPREVGRLEVQMKGKELRRYFAGESDAELLAQLHDPHHRVSIFESAVRTMYDFRIGSSDGRSRSAKRMHEWDWTLCTTNAPEQLQREQRARTISPQRIKAGLHLLYDVHLWTSLPEVREIAEKVAVAAGQEFVDYLHSHERQWSQLNDAITIGTRKRIGATDEFSLSFMRRLAKGVRDDANDPLQRFLDDAAPVQVEYPEEG